MTSETAPERRPVAGRRSGWLVPLVLLLVGIGLFAVAINAADGDLSLSGPRLAPVLVTGVWVLVALAYLIRRPESEPEPVGWLAPAGVAACLVVFAIALEYAGFVVSAFLFILAVSRVLGSRSIVRDLIVALVLPLAVYLAFTRLLDIFLPGGILPL